MIQIPSKKTYVHIFVRKVYSLSLPCPFPWFRVRTHLSSNFSSP